MPKLLFSGFILIASTGARVSSRVLTRNGSGKPPPATTGREMRRISYTEFMLGAPVGRADVGCAGRAMCLDQGRSVGGSAPRTPISRHCHRNVFGSMRSFERGPLPVMHSACNGLQTVSDSLSLGLRVQNCEIRRDFYLGRDVSCGSMAAVEAGLIVSPVSPRLRKCCVRRGCYAWCHNRTFAADRTESPRHGRSGSRASIEDNQKSRYASDALGSYRPAPPAERPRPWRRL